MSDQYKPSEHDGLRKDGQTGVLLVLPILRRHINGCADRRMEQDSFAYGKVDPHEAGKQGGQTSGIGSGGNTSSKGEFAHGKVDPVEAGKKGGKSS